MRTRLNHACDRKNRRKATRPLVNEGQTETYDCEKVWADGGDTSTDRPHVIHDTVAATERQQMLDELSLAEITDISGSFWGDTSSPGEPHEKVEHYTSMEVSLVEWSRPWDPDIGDIVEVCGGENRVIQYLTCRLHRKGFRRGLNLLVASERHWVWVYIEACKPIVVVMPPPCRGMRGYAEQPHHQPSDRRTVA